MNPGWARLTLTAWLLAGWNLVAGTALGAETTAQTVAVSSASASNPPLEFIQVSPNRRGFVRAGSGTEFRPWGFNYDHDRANRLLETYWLKEWETVVSDFAEMKALGANTVRIHLQLGQFMKSATKPNRQSLAQLGRLVALAETNGLYLDITGLGCYDKPTVPAWYNRLAEGPRWEVQARFWEAVAAVGRPSPAVFCYDLMNEPVVSEAEHGRDWTPGAFADRYFVQRLTLKFAGRSPEQIAQAWVDQLTTAVKRQDSRHLLTVGAIPWALTWTNARPLFYSPQVSRNLDFVSLHFYPKQGQVKEALTALAVYDIGKPMVLEELFPLSCSVTELDQFIDGSRSLACGWIGFYWGKTIAEYQASKGSIADSLAVAWLEYFARKTPELGR